MAYATWILFTTHLRRTALSKRALYCLVLALAPVGAALVLLAANVDHAIPATPILWVLEVQTALPLVSLLLGSAVVAEEVEDRTVTYLFTRPLPRAALLLGRWLAVLVVQSLLLGVSTWVAIRLLAPAAAADPEMAMSAASELRLLETVLLGGAVYSLLFAVAGSFLKHPVIVGLAYCFAFEVLFANFPGGTQRMTVLYYLKSFLAGGDVGTRSRLYEIVAVEPVSPTEALVRLLVVAALALALGVRVISRKQYVLPS